VNVCSGCQAPLQNTPATGAAENGIHVVISECIVCIVIDELHLDLIEHLRAPGAICPVSEMPHKAPPYGNSDCYTHANKQSDPKICASILGRVLQEPHASQDLRRGHRSRR
jgi:hypothetical protein